MTAPMGKKRRNVSGRSHGTAANTSSPAITRARLRRKRDSAGRAMFLGRAFQDQLPSARLALACVTEERPAA
jgi:hypothetical protein